MRKITIITIVALLIGAFCLSGLKLFQMSGGYLQESVVKDSLAAYKPGAQESQGTRADGIAYTPSNDEAVPGPAGAQADGPFETDRPATPLTVNQNIIDMQNEINPDVVGWLTIPGTHIDYPFVRASDNDFYVRRDIYGNNATAGTIFTDWRCAEDLSDFNLILYGHNMRNKSMFGDLQQYSDPWFFDNALNGTMFLQYGTYTLEVFAFMVISADDEIIYNPGINSEVFFNYVMENARNYSEPVSRDRVVTLSTCGYEFEDARIVAIATLVTVHG